MAIAVAVASASTETTMRMATAVASTGTTAQGVCWTIIAVVLGALGRLLMKIGDEKKDVGALAIGQLLCLIAVVAFAVGLAGFFHWFSWQ